MQVSASIDHMLSSQFKFVSKCLWDEGTYSPEANERKELLVSVFPVKQHSFNLMNRGQLRLAHNKSKYVDLL